MECPVIGSLRFDASELDHLAPFLGFVREELADRVTDQGVTTVQETLRYVPGVFADAYGPGSRGDYPRVRGSDPDIYLDGMRLVDSFKFNEARIDPYLLSRIEVLRGPSSVLYDNTATASIINLVSKRPQDGNQR